MASSSSHCPGDDDSGAHSHPVGACDDDDDDAMILLHSSHTKLCSIFEGGSHFRGCADRVAIQVPRPGCLRCSRHVFKQRHMYYVTLKAR